MIPEKDIRVDTHVSGRGRNKFGNVRIQHLPTGEVAVGDSERGFAANREVALRKLEKIIGATHE